MNWTRRWALSTAVILALTGCASPGSPDVVVVEVTETGFSPAVVVVAPGTEIRWTNLDARAHTVTNGGPLQPGQEAVPPGTDEFTSGRLLEGEGFSHVFAAEGDHHYWCEYHGEELQMVGTIRVEEP